MRLATAGNRCEIKNEHRVGPSHNVRCEATDSIRCGMIERDSSSSRASGAARHGLSILPSNRTSASKGPKVLPLRQGKATSRGTDREGQNPERPPKKRGVPDRPRPRPGQKTDPREPLASSKRASSLLPMLRPGRTRLIAAPPTTKPPTNRAMLRRTTSKIRIKGNGSIERL